MFSFIFQEVLCGHSNIFKEEEIHTTSFSQCVVEASKLYFTNDYDTVIYAIFEEVHPQTHTIIRLLQSDISWLILLKNLNSTFHDLPRSHNKNNYIIQISNQEQLIGIVQVLRSLSSWNPHAKFVVITSEAVKNPTTVFAEFMKSLWNTDVVSSAILLPTERNASLSELYSTSLHRQLNSISPGDYCSFGTFHNDTAWFAEPVGTCTTDCTLKVMYLEWPPVVMNAEMGFQSSNYLLNQGIDMNLINMIVDYFNLTVSYRRGALWGQIYENGTAMGNLKHLLNKDVDVLIGGYFTTVERCAFFDVSNTYIQAFPLCCVPDVSVLTDFRGMHNIFRIELWMLVISVFICISICICLSSKWNKGEFTGYTTIGGTLLKDISVLLGISTNALPRSAVSRYFMALLIIFGFEITLFYTGYLTSILSAPKYTQKYNTLKDVYAYELETYIVPYTESWILDDNSVANDVPVNVIKQRWKSCRNRTWCYEKVAISKDSAFYIDDLVTDYVITTQGYSMNCLKLTAVGSYYSILMRRGFPLHKQFTNIIDRIFEAGILTKWKKDILKIKKGSNDSNDAKIEYKNLEPIFYFVIVGNAVSFVVFLGELICHSILKSFFSIGK